MLRRGKKFLLTILAGAVFLSGFYFLIVRPWHTRWNCTGEDVSRVIAGDELVPHPTFITNRGISIQAKPDSIWPWLVQLGEGRGGFYSYDWIDHLLGFDINSADRILPQFQSPPQPGGIIPRGMYIWAVKNDQYLVLGTPPSFAGFQTTWALALFPQTDGSTKLISRLRIHYDRWSLPNLLIAAVLDPGQFIMEQKMLRTLKTLVERKEPS